MARYVAKHTFDPQGRAECIALAAGETVVVTDSSRADWWIGHRESDASQSGSFPAAYVQPAAEAELPPREVELAAPAPAPAPCTGPAEPPASPRCVVKHDFDPAGRAECIKLAAGEEVVVTDSSRPDWWVGHRTSEPSRTGSFPAAYVVPAPETEPEPEPEAAPPDGALALAEEERERVRKAEEWAAEQERVTAARAEEEQAARQAEAEAARAAQVEAEAQAAQAEAEAKAAEEAKAAALAAECEAVSQA